MPEPTTGDLTFMARDSQLIVVGELKRLGAAPGRIGDPCAWQGATYRVVEVLRGSPPDGELRVAHPVCLGHPLVDNRTVGLSPSHYTPGAKFILFLRPEARRPSNPEDGAGVADYIVWSERTGSLPVSDALREEVAKAVAAAGGPGSTNDPFRGRRRR